MRSLLFHVSCLVLCTTGVSSARPVAETQESDVSTSAIYQKGSACVNMAATLGACLAAVSPVSTLTTMEESECCSSIHAFQKAGCHCLSAESLESMTKADRWAYRRRINTLRKVHGRCGWEAFTCPGRSLANSLLGVDIDSRASEQVLTSSEIASWANDRKAMKEQSGASSWDSSWIEAGDARGSQRLLGSSDSQGIASIIAQSSSRDNEIRQLTEYVRSAVELADAMSQAQDSQVEIQIDVVLESTREEDHPYPIRLFKQDCLTKVLAGTLPEIWLTLNVWLTLSVLSLVACLIAFFLRRQSKAAAVEPCCLHGVVSAAEEAAAFSKMGREEESVHLKP